MQRPSLLETLQNPLVALYRYFNVQHTTTPIGSAIGPTFDMRVYCEGRMPTHVLAVSQTDQDPDNTIPLMVPIDRTLFERGFTLDLGLPPPPAAYTPPVPRSINVAASTSEGAPETQQIVVVALPVIHVSAPHLHSLPLLMLYAMALETDTNILAWRLLPVEVVEEFPNAAAMSTVLSRARDDLFDRIYRHNQGMWRNILSLGLSNNTIVQVVQTAWNVSADARRLRLRANLYG